MSGGRPHDFYSDFLADWSGPTVNLVQEPREASAGRKELSPLKPLDILQGFPESLRGDIPLLDPSLYHSKNRAFNFQVEGDPERIWLHPEAELSPLSVINTIQGDVVIEKNVRVSPFSYLCGPLYIGDSTIMNRASISHSRVGKSCRIGGEITHSIIGDFTNKNHEGFLGHSIIGDWVNLGAMTSTSNLKNNYGLVRLNHQNREYNTSTQKFGSIIGDFSKTAVGTFLTTGSILDVGCLLFDGRPLQKYYPPFFWGGKEPTVYQLDLLLRDIKNIMKRRGEEPSERLIRLITNKHIKSIQQR